MKELTATDVVTQAQKEFQEEEFRKKVERHKEKLRLRKNFWVRVFPWRIKIERRDEPKATQILCNECLRRDMNDALRYQVAGVDRMNKLNQLFETGVLYDRR